MKRDLIPATWRTWGKFPKPTDNREEEHTCIPVIWRAFSPGDKFIIDIRWEPERDLENGSYAVRLVCDNKWLEPKSIYKTKKLGMLVTEIQRIMKEEIKGKKDK